MPKNSIKKKEYDKKYYLKNKERLREYHRQYYQRKKLESEAYPHTI